MKYITKTQPIDLDIHGISICNVYPFENALEMAGDLALVCIVYEGLPSQEIVFFEKGDDRLYDIYYRTRGARFYAMLPDKIDF